MATQDEISQVVKGWRVGERRFYECEIAGAFMQSLRTGFKKRGWHMAAHSENGGVSIRRLIVSNKAPK